MIEQKRVGIIHAYPNRYMVDSLHQAGYTVVLIGNGEEFEGHSGVEAILTTPLWDTSAIQETVQAYHCEKPFDALIPVNEGNIVVTATLCEKLGLQGGMSTTAALVSRNKYLSFMVWGSLGVPVPLTYPVYDAESTWKIIESKLGGVGVIKLIDSMNSQGVIAVSTKEECKEAVNSLHKMTEQSVEVDSMIDRNRFAYGQSGLKLMVQHFCEGVEVSVDVFLMPDGEDRVLAILEKDPASGPYFAETASVWPTSMSPDREAEVGALAIRAARALGLKGGAAHVEIRYTGDQPMVLEAGLRPGGGYTVQLIERLLDENVFVSQASLAVGHTIATNPCLDLPAVLFGGIKYPQSGVLKKIDGMDIFNELGHLEQLVILNETGDQVMAVPESAQPHFCYYLLSGSSRDELINVHSQIQTQVKLSVEVDAHYTT